MKLRDIIYIGLAIFLACILIVGYNKCSNSRVENSQNNIARQILNDSTSYYKDQFGKEHAKRQQIETDLATAKVYYGSLIDSVTAALKIKSKNLRSISTVSTENNNTVALKVDTVYRNGTTTLSFKYKDVWVKFNGVIGDSSKLTYSIYDSIILTSYQKSTGFLGMGKKLIYIDGYSANPNTKVVGISDVRISGQKVKKFSLGIGIGYGYNGNKFEPVIGLSLHYSLFSF